MSWRILLSMVIRIFKHLILFLHKFIVVWISCLILIFFDLCDLSLELILILVSELIYATVWSQWSLLDNNLMWHILFSFDISKLKAICLNGSTSVVLSSISKSVEIIAVELSFDISMCNIWIVKGIMFNGHILTHVSILCSPRNILVVKWSRLKYSRTVLS